METGILSASSWKDSSDDAQQTMRREDLEVEGVVVAAAIAARDNDDQGDGKVGGGGSVLPEGFRNPLFGAQDYALIGKRFQ